MNRIATLTCIAAIALLGLHLGADGAFAQQTRTLVIHDGEVHIDGEVVPKAEWPSSLDLSGVSAQYQFVGIQRPVVEIDGRLFAVTDRLEPVSKDEVQGADASVVLRNLGRPNAARGSLTATPRRQGLQATGTMQNAPASDPASSRLSERQMAHQEYLSEVQRQSRELYERLLRERRMEQQTYELARTIRRLPEGEERQAQIDTLRATLNRIFDLKQENRRREIEQLQRQIMELQQSLRKREEMRDTMIDHRLQQLIDAGN
jgi:hypothetical protein